MNIALDTNIILNAVDTLEVNERFENDTFTISMKVISELDNLKEFGRTAEIKYKARRGNRTIERMLDSGKVKIVDCCENPSMSPDDIIIESYMNHFKDIDKVISNDLNFRLKCKAKGLVAEKYSDSKKDSYTGYQDILIDNDIYMELMRKGEYKASRYLNSFEGLVPNSCIRFINNLDTNQKLLYVWDTKSDTLTSVDNLRKTLSFNGLTPLTDEQAVYMWMLKNDNIKAVLSDSVAGSAKTLFALAYGIEGIKQGKHKAIMYLKTLDKVGDSAIGFYKGTKSEKIEQEYYSSIVYALKTYYKLFRVEDAWGMLHHMIDTGELIVENLGDIRGISLDDCCVICDEFQNSTLSTALTCLSRVSDIKNKLIMLGSSMQIDSKYLTQFDNGLTMLIESEHYKNHPSTASINMVKSKRGEMAQLSSDIYNEYR